MRRVFSIFLILFFAVGPLSAFADGGDDAGLPSCCRRHGTHHCAMDAQKMAMKTGVAVDSTTSFSAPPTCPLYHGPALFTLTPAHALTAAAASIRAEFTHSPAPVFERIVAFSRPTRAYAGRGPPAADLN
jgi:hypothetical protein